MCTPCSSDASLQRLSLASFPCEHNNWDDVRQRKGVKVLRCRTCNAVWRWVRGQHGLQRCIDFLNGRCTKAHSECGSLHVHRSKHNADDRVSLAGTGSQVLSCVSEGDMSCETSSEMTVSPVINPTVRCRAACTPLAVVPLETSESESGPNTPSSTSSWLDDNDDVCNEDEEVDVLSLYWQAGLL
eukprot:TRINITY_DN345_c0_g2_i1.p1 TRINITY_DN345_c0_g2~~TRINITY_DN345_c0_g2_i1.p1  ORF type:complete len:185 (+),score=47.81 TRINITY_DN345_c0_g2_i1:59-613(+)